MKKLMIAAAVVMAAVCSQAAAISWNSSAIYMAADKTGTFGTGNSMKIKDGASAYLFNIDKATYDSLLVLGANDSIDWAATSAKVWDTYGSQLEKATVNGTTAKATSIVKLSDGVNYTPATDTLYYGVVIYTYTDANYGDMYIANLASAKVVAGQQGDSTVSALNTTYGGTGSVGAGTITGWTAVPEPTSGLLLLLGVAGLALRRRRA